MNKKNGLRNFEEKDTIIPFRCPLKLKSVQVMVRIFSIFSDKNVVFSEQFVHKLNVNSIVRCLIFLPFPFLIM